MVTRVLSTFTINTWWLCTQAPHPSPPRGSLLARNTWTSWVRHCAQLYWTRKIWSWTKQTPGDEALPAAEYVPDVSSRPGPDFCGMESSGSQTAGRSASGRSESAHVDTRDRRAPRPTRARGCDASGPLSSNRGVGGRSGGQTLGGSEKLRAEKVQTGPARRLQALGGCLRMSFRGNEAF